MVESLPTQEQSILGKVADFGVGKSILGHSLHQRSFKISSKSSEIEAADGTSPSSRHNMHFVSHSERGPEG
jgi:hypothetical protein